MVKATTEKKSTKKTTPPARPRVHKVEALADIKTAEVKTTASKKPFITAIGRRKTAVARVKFLDSGTGKITVNGKDYKKYFNFFTLQEAVTAPLILTQENKGHDVEVIVQGGGKLGQAEAIRLGITRALIEWNPDLKPSLRAVGYVTRDPRAKERKKFGLKKARRAPQWSKR